MSFFAGYLRLAMYIHTIFIIYLCTSTTVYISRYFNDVFQLNILLFYSLPIVSVLYPIIVPQVLRP